MNTRLKISAVFAGYLAVSAVFVIGKFPAHEQQIPNGADMTLTRYDVGESARVKHIHIRPAVEQRRHSTPTPRSMPIAGSEALSRLPPEEELAYTAVFESQPAVERAFLAEPLDDKWSELASVEARRQVARSLPAHTAIEAVECRSTMCRVQMVHDSVSHYESWIAGVFQHREESAADEGFWSGRDVIAHLTTDRSWGGPATSEAYLARADSVLADDPVDPSKSLPGALQ